MKADVITRSINNLTAAQAAKAGACFLGWFSVGLAGLEILMPRSLSRWLDSGTVPLWWFYGSRELAAGLGLLTSPNKAFWLWARVGGDVLDIATLASGLVTSRRKAQVGTALGLVLGITALDVLCARAFTRET